MGNEGFLSFGIVHEKGGFLHFEIVMDEGHHFHGVLPGPFQIVEVPAVRSFFYILIASHGGRKDVGAGEGSEVGVFISEGIVDVPENKGPFRRKGFFFSLFLFLLLFYGEFPFLRLVGIFQAGLTAEEGKSTYLFPSISRYGISTFSSFFMEGGVVYT